MNLVTGATGILGSHVLLSLLQQGRPVVAAKRPGSDISRVRELFLYYSRENESLFERIKWIDLDVLDYDAVEDALQGVAVVYHCAGLVSFDPADRKKLFRINEGGARNVVNACLHIGNVQMCHVSSIGAISNSDRPVLDESVFWKKSGTESDYALSKYNGEREVWRGIEEGLEAVIVNPGVILAPVFWEQSSGRIFRKCYRGNAFYTSGSSAYISGMDAALAMVTLVAKHCFGQRYILIENNYDFRFILGRIQKNFSRKPPYLAVPRSLLVLVSFFGRMFRTGSVLTKSLINSAYNRQVYSNAKVKQATGMEFEPIPEVIDRVCGYYRTVSAREPSKR